MQTRVLTDAGRRPHPLIHTFRFSFFVRRACGVLTPYSRKRIEKVQNLDEGANLGSTMFFIFIVARWFENMEREKNEKPENCEPFKGSENR